MYGVHGQSRLETADKDSHLLGSRVAHSSQSASHAERQPASQPSKADGAGPGLKSETVGY